MSSFDYMASINIKSHLAFFAKIDRLLGSVCKAYNIINIFYCSTDGQSPGSTSSNSMAAFLC